MAPTDGLEGHSESHQASAVAQPVAKVSVSGCCRQRKVGALGTNAVATQEVVGPLLADKSVEFTEKDPVNHKPGGHRIMGVCAMGCHRLRFSSSLQPVASTVTSSS